MPTVSTVASRPVHSLVPVREGTLESGAMLVSNRRAVGSGGDAVVEVVMEEMT